MKCEDPCLNCTVEGRCIEKCDRYGYYFDKSGSPPYLCEACPFVNSKSCKKEDKKIILISCLDGYYLDSESESCSVYKCDNNAVKCD